MAIHEDEVAMAKLALPEYLTLSLAGVETGGLGFPVATLLFSVVDIIGSYHRGDPGFTVIIGDEKIAIPSVNDHLRILNSKYFGDPVGFGLTATQINRLHALARSRVTHNALIGEGCVLAEGEPKRPAISEIAGVIWIYLPELWNRCRDAVARFLAVADTVIPASAVVRELRDKEARQGVNYAEGVRILRELPGATVANNVTAMGRPDPPMWSRRVR
jgi:hypothetical protein